MAGQIIDDKSEHCIPFLLARLKLHRQNSDAPFFLGLNGVQGAGKTTLVSALKKALKDGPHKLHAAVLSLDDFYLRHDDQVALAAAHPDNPLVQHRGQPSTHDLALLESVLSSLQGGRMTKLPVYDKSQYQGAGDRKDTTTWEEVNRPQDAPVDVIIFEGWCVGFRAISEADLTSKREKAVEGVVAGVADEGVSEEVKRSQVGRTELEHLLFVNEALKKYEKFWDYFDAFLHIDAQKPLYVYQWRWEAEQKMQAEKGSGMTAEQVKRFIDGYYSSYELYTENLRETISEHEDSQMRLVIDEDRKVVSVHPRR